MKCRYCGTENRAHNTYCVKCAGSLYTKFARTIRRKEGLLNHLLDCAASRNPSAQCLHLYA